MFVKRKLSYDMIAVSLLIFDDVVPSSVTGVLDLLSGANKYLEQQGKPPAFAVELVSEKEKTIILLNQRQQIANKTFGEIKHADLIIVPSFDTSNKNALNNNKAIVQWIKDMNRAGTEIASLCVGCYFLAEAGLLDGKEATSHWAAINDMQQKYPEVIMKSDLVITDQDGIYTSGGAFSSLKLVLYIIEKFAGRETALWVSKMYAIEMDRASRAHFAVFAGQHQHGDNEILKAQHYIEQNYSALISTDVLSLLVCLSKRNFIRRFKLATNNTPFEYLQRVRIESAKKAIEMNEQSFDLIMDSTGYKDMKSFKKIFNRLTGISPQEYKRKYGRIKNLALPEKQS